MTQWIGIMFALALQGTQAHKPAAPFVQKVAGTALSIEMLPLPRANGDDEKLAWMSATEVTWDLYDAFVFRLDEPKDGEKAEANADALARPSKPYILMDRGFGHAGYPAISVSYLGAQSFCVWLSAKSGKKFRLPTEAEWQRACAATAPADLDEYAWHQGNAERKTHPVKTKKPNAAGFYDLAGNASEWCVDAEGKPIVLGGSYRTLAEGVGCALRLKPSASWNASDPQIPKSKWWLADGGFVGFRIVCESD